MDDDSFAWSEDQWSRIRQVVHDEALRTRVAASFLPLYGPLPAASETVPANLLDFGASDTPPPAKRMSVVDFETLRLLTVSVNVYLKNHMVGDPELTAATIMFRRAADIIARLEDAIVFNGRDTSAKLPIKGIDGVEPVYTVSGADRYAGLMDFAKAPIKVDPNSGPDVFEKVVDAVLQLEAAGHHKPFACVLSTELFRAINRPIPNSMVLPRDSIPPFLEGPLLRSSNMPACSGLVVSLQGNPVEIVVPQDIAVRRLQTTLDAKHVFRVSQRFVLRVKEPSAIATITG